MKIIFLFLLLISCLNSNLIAQVNETDKRSIFESNNYYESDSTNTRSVFSSFLISTGYPEILNIIRIGYQINNRFSLAVRLSVYANNTSSNSAGSFSFGSEFISLEFTNYFKKIFVFNNIKIISGYTKKNYLGDISIGYESTSNRTINAYYAVGFSLEVFEHNEPFFTPSFKIGLNINF